MKPEEFVYWLQGYFELCDKKTLSKKQVAVIQDHLALVLTKTTPDRNVLLEDKSAAGSDSFAAFYPGVKLCGHNDTYC